MFSCVTSRLCVKEVRHSWVLGQLMGTADQLED